MKVSSMHFEFKINGFVADDGSFKYDQAPVGEGLTVKVNYAEVSQKKRRFNSYQIHK